MAAAVQQQQVYPKCIFQIFLLYCYATCSELNGDTTTSFVVLRQYVYLIIELLRLLLITGGQRTEKKGENGQVYPKSKMLSTHFLFTSFGNGKFFFSIFSLPCCTGRDSKLDFKVLMLWFISSMQRDSISLRTNFGMSMRF